MRQVTSFAHYYVCSFKCDSPVVERHKTPMCVYTSRAWPSDHTSDHTNDVKHFNAPSNLSAWRSDAVQRERCCPLS